MSEECYMVHQGPFSRCLFRTSLSETPTQEPSPANDLEKDLSSQHSPLWQPFPKSQRNIHTKAKHKEQNWMLLHFLSALSPWKHQSTILCVGFTSVALSAPHRTTLSLEEYGCPRNISYSSFLIDFYWSIAVFQCCISFYLTEKWISYMFTYILSFLDFPPI